MTQPPAAPKPAGKQPPSPRRIAVVYTTLALAVGLGWLAGSAAMPKTDGSAESPSPAPPVPNHARSGLEDLIWPCPMGDDRPWQFIIIHHTATHQGTLESITRGHRERLHTEDTGYHFIINNGQAEGTRDGEITPTPRWLDQRGGAHCLVERHPEFNGDGIGIALVGHFNQYRPTPNQMASLERLVLLLRARYEVPLDRIYGHGELKPTECPGRLFPLDEFLLDIRRSYIQERLR
jgi:hypothetical protein